jgi:hypothetical protein
MIPLDKPGIVELLDEIERNVGEIRGRLGSSAEEIVEELDKIRESINNIRKNLG